MIRADYTVRVLQAIAFVLGLAILMWTTGFPGNLGKARADAVTSASDTISDSAPSTVSNHLIQFTTPNGLVSGQTILITFDGAFTLPSTGFDFNDMDLATGTEEVLGSSAAAGVWVVATTSSSITFTTPTDYGVASATTIATEIGTNATAGATGDSQIINPSATTSYPITIGGTMQDSGEVLVAIIDTVTVSASVSTVFDFTVAGVPSGQTVGSTSPTTTVAASTVNTLPFGTLTPGTSLTLGHDLTVVTNAANGFNVTVEQSGDLLSSTGADINSFIDGAYTDTPTAWTGPAGTVGTDTTYGHWGLTSDDADFSATSDRWVAASTTPRSIFSNTTVADGTGTGTGITRVGYQIQISPLQEAGNDYSTQLTYIATPTF